jgi:anti-repressor protein
MNQPVIVPAVFNYQDRAVRSISVDGETIAVAADICAILDIKHVASAMANVDPEDKFTFTRPEGVGSNHSLWQQMDPRANSVTMVNEGGAMDLVMQSRKPEAMAFRRWLTRMVWPSIRDTGSYSVVPALTEDQIVQQALAITNRRVGELTAKVEELEPKAQYYDRHQAAEGAYSWQEVAQRLDMGRTTLLRRLRELHIVMDREGNPPYAEHIHHFEVPERQRVNNTGTGYVTYRVTLVKPDSVEWIRRRLNDE